MKKTIKFLGAAVLALAVVGCQNEPVDEPATPIVPDEPTIEESAEFVLRATLPTSRTILNDDYSLSWSSSDQLAVFNAPTGTADYSANLHFVTKVDENQEAQPGVFVAGEGIDVPFEDGVNYDWYVLAPWRETNGAEEIKTPKGQSKEDGYFPIGAQTQTGYNNSVHVSSADLLVGKVTNTRTPNVALKHLAVLHKFTVTNNSDAPTTITKLTFNGGENKIFGTFWIDLTADEPAIDITKANATFNERALTVKDGTELAKGESADFYVVTAPFTFNTGETFKVTIETSTGKQVVETTATSDIEFKAGSYNTATLVYDYEAPAAEAVDHLYSDTFNGTFANSSSVTSKNSTFTPERWDTYDKGGMLVYDGNVAAVSYTHDTNSTLSRYANNAVVGMDDLYVWFKVNGVLTVSGIKLHGKTDLNLSFYHTYKSSSLKTEYSVDGGTTWNEIGTSTTEARAYLAEPSFNFSVPAGSETISLRFTATVAAVRIDNVKLSWQ